MKKWLISTVSAGALFAATNVAAQTEAPKPTTAADTVANPATIADATQDDAQTDDIVVTGLRRSLQSAQNIKRNAEGIVDSIVAEDIGKLPDVTASAALARVTGVQVTRAAGEAAGVQIRGLPDISTTYNGREIFTAENRFVAIQDFPAGAVQALEVYKSSTANLIEGGIGGQVNVRSRRPFDFDGFQLSGSLNGVHWEQSQRLDYNGNLLVTDRWDTGIGEIGVLVNAAISNIDFLDATREVDRFVTPEPGAPADAAGFTRPNGQGIFYGSGNRWRPSVNAAVQWRPASNLEFYIDGLFQGYRAEDRNHWLFVPTFGDGAQYSNVVLRNGSNSVQSMTVTGASTPDGYDAFTRARTDTYQLAGGAIWTAGRLKLTGDVAYTDSTYTQQSANIDYAFTRSPTRNVDFDIARGKGGGVFDFVDFDASDPNNYALRGLFDANFRATGKDWQARLDAEYDMGLDFLPTLQAGVRFNTRDAARYNGQRYAGLIQTGLTYPDLPVQIGPITRGFRFDNDQPVTVFPGATFDSVFDNRDPLRAIAGFGSGNPAFNDQETFTASERSWAGYAQAKYAFDVGLPIEGNLGVRVINTRTQVQGNSYDATTDTFTPVAQTNRYTDYLPNANLRATLARDLQLRIAFTQTRTRPNFIDLNPSSNVGTVPTACSTEGIDTVNCFVPVTSGNPNLNPLRSNNYDLSLEYYYAPAGSLTAGVFRRDVSNFIFRSTTNIAIAGAPDRRVNSPSNGGNGRVQGAEVAFTGFLDIARLPEWARGFGVQANYTYLDASTELAPEFRDRLAGQQPFPGVSKHSFNLVGLYERPVFSARLAYNWRSRFATEYQDLQAGFLAPLYQKSLGVMDFSTTVTPVPNVTIAFDLLNVLGTPVRNERAYDAAGDSYPFQVRYIERTYSLGVRFRF